jgi:hypothetical protein
MFKAYAKAGKDADLKTWAQNTLPTLEEHKQMAHTTHVAPAAHTHTTP